MRRPRAPLRTRNAFGIRHGCHLTNSAYHRYAVPTKRQPKAQPTVGSPLTVANAHQAASIIHSYRFSNKHGRDPDVGRQGRSHLRRDMFSSEAVTLLHPLKTPQSAQKPRKACSPCSISPSLSDQPPPNLFLRLYIYRGTIRGLPSLHIPRTQSSTKQASQRPASSKWLNHTWLRHDFWRKQPS